MAPLLLLSLFALAQGETCQDRLGILPPREGQKWVDAPKCYDCKDDECIGCENGGNTGCARCVYNEVACSATVGKSICLKYKYGQDKRGDKCEGLHVPFLPIENHGLCKGDDIKELNDKPAMTFHQAQQECAAYLDQAAADEDDEGGICFGFEWKNAGDAVGVPLSPKTCPDEPPNYNTGIMWREDPQCYGCVGKACLGCETGNTSTCSRCVFDRVKCEESSTPAICDKWRWGASLRGHTSRDCLPNHPPTGQHQFIFKSKWRPSNGPCTTGNETVASVNNASPRTEQSVRRGADPKWRHNLEHPDASKKITSTDLDTVFKSKCNGCKAFSVCPGKAPWETRVDADISAENNMVHDRHCAVWTLHPGAFESTEESAASIVI